MQWPRQLWMRLQTLFRRNRFAEQLCDEIRFHLDEQIAENTAAGMSPEDARHAALRLFGNSTWLKEETRATWDGYGSSKSARTFGMPENSAHESRICGDCNSDADAWNRGHDSDFQRRASGAVAAAELFRAGAHRFVF